MYQAMENCIENIYDIIMPHELLMMILIYSQGFKFEIGDYVICFASGLFGQSSQAKIIDIIEDDKQGQSYMVRSVALFHSHLVGGKCKVAFNHTFA